MKHGFRRGGLIICQGGKLDGEPLCHRYKVTMRDSYCE